MASLQNTTDDDLPSSKEAMFYYSGLCSGPRLVYRTGAIPWTEPTGPEAYRKLKELHPVFGHKLNVVWKDLGPKVIQLLDANDVLWTSIDVVRFLKIEQGEVVGRVVLWIGVAPESLSGKDARTSANGCLGLLKEFGVDDVDVEFRESIYTSLVGPDLLKPASDYNPEVDVRGPLTPTLGLSIAAQATPHVEGTGGIYLAEGGDSEKILLITARHVLIPPNDGPNLNYTLTNSHAPPRKVLLLGINAFEKFLDSIKTRLRGHGIMVDLHQREIEDLRARVASGDSEEAEEATEYMKKTESSLERAMQAIIVLEKFYEKSKFDWRISQRVVGHIAYSPPLAFGAGTEGFTEDYAVVELDGSRFKSAFKGNVIDLGTKIPLYEFVRKMRDNFAPDFEYPLNRLLPLRDLISEQIMHEPDTHNKDGEPGLMVIKSGIGTGVTIGRANGVFSYVRKYFGNNTHQTSMEWAILPFDHESGPFATLGDSGSIVVDSRGRIGGLLTGAAGHLMREDFERDPDITYATPFFWLLARIKQNGFPNAHIYPVLE